MKEKVQERERLSITQAQASCLVRLHTELTRVACAGAKRTVLGKKGKGALSSADAIAEEGLHLDDKYEGPLGDMRRNWDEFSSALNCYGAVTAARDSCAPSSSSSGRKDRGACDPGIWS